MMEFHVSRQARDRYRFDRSLFSFAGNVMLLNPAASREFAQRMNLVRDAEKRPEQTIHPGALFSMGLIDELSHVVIHFYRTRLDPRAMTDALAWFEGRMGADALDAALRGFVERFPSTEVYRGGLSAAQWLRTETDGIPHRAAALEELTMLWMANQNPAFAVFSELFRDEELSKATPYREVAGGLREFFETRPRIGRDRQNLIDLLRQPALASPDSLSGQLAFIREKWGEILGDLLNRILLALDILKEEEIAIWMRFHPPTAETLARRQQFPWSLPGSHGPSLADSAHEAERFSPDQDWMPTTVLLAKSTYVWLEQLSRKHGWHIHRLDHVPDEELALIQRRGINALWLIGVWERSAASESIKKLCGNHDAVASAYSLHGYRIAADLGGDEAYRNLRGRALAHGIRLASDMVPNHMGIDSNWVIEHPNWFMGRDDCPYPSYRFEGPDLSRDGRVEIKIDDHYYEQTDAAVVFRRRDRWTGGVRYIYHGNDGTSFPWNDTAQIDYLNAEAREQVIQTILHVARLFPIIRFDAAMTLAKRHFQRLWYPIAGTGGGIPSRAEYSLTREQFDAAMPHEFWREVVDRVAQEVPGTLLLAEAFWLMEGYFVRTLGMHRVYNSAFMHMLRDEDNAKYRSVIKNTIEFDPDILKRYVNFMSNPDERTAIDQFGDGDKCFGVAAVMATLPGLPMFGHGQIEGFTEKYGMEFRHPRMREEPVPWLVARHERQIAPLLERRWLFAESQDFRLFDLYTESGTVDENVFAYSNRRGDQRSLVVYHNKYAETRGTLHHSASFADKSLGRSRRDSLAGALSLPNDDGVILAFRDSMSGLEYLARSGALATQGLSVELRAYQCHVFLDWRELRPSEQWPWDRFCDVLGGRGVPNLDEALLRFELEPLYGALGAALGAEILDAFAAVRDRAQSLHAQGGLMERSGAFFEQLASAYGRKVLGRSAGFAPRSVEFEAALHRRIEGVCGLADRHASIAQGDPAASVLPAGGVAGEQQTGGLPADWRPVWASALGWCLISASAEAIVGAWPEGAPGGPVPDVNAISLEIFDRLRLRETLARAASPQGGSEGGSTDVGWRAAARLRLAFLAAADAAGDSGLTAGIPARVWSDGDGIWLLGVHQVEGETYFNRELHEQMVWWMQFPALAGASGGRRGGANAARKVRPKTAPESGNGGGQNPQIPNSSRASGAERSQTKPPSLSSKQIAERQRAVRRAKVEAEQAGYRTGHLRGAADGRIAGAPAARPGEKR